MEIKFTDRAEIGGTKLTGDGYLVATSRVARTGAQKYLARELGDVAIAAGFDGDAVVTVWRDADQVFAKDTLASITRVPVTLGHPKEQVTADNWREFAVGDVGDAYSKDGDWIVVNPMIKDAAALAAARTTHREISMGYTAEIVPARDGIDADFEQVNIRMNHLALVPRGRAGSQARIGDAQEWGAAPVTVEDDEMAVEVKTVILGDKAVEVAAKDADTVANILKDHAAELAVKDTEIGRLTAELADAKAKVLTDAQVADMVKAKVEADTKRAAVKAKLGDDADKMTDAQIEGAFLVVSKVKGSSAVADAIADGVAEIKDADVLIQEAIKKRFNKEAK